MNSGHHWCFCEVYLDVALVCPSRRCHPTNKYIYGLPVYQNQWCGQTSSHTKQITQIIANLHAPSSFNRGGNPSCQIIDEAWEISLPLIITKWGQIQPPFPPRNPSQGFPVLLTDCSDVVQRVFPEVRFTGSDWAKSSKKWGRRRTFLEFASQKYTMFGAWFSSTRHPGVRKLDIMPWYAMAATSISQLMPDASKLETSRSFQEPSKTKQTEPMKQHRFFVSDNIWHDGADQAVQTVLPESMHTTVFA